MRLRSKLFLALAILFWIVEYTPLGTKLHGIPLPVAAVFFGLFLITWAFPPRMFDEFDKDQALRKQLIVRERKMKRQHRAQSRVRWRTREQATGAHL